MKAPLALLLVACSAGFAAQPDARPPDLQSVRIFQTVDPVFPESLVPLYRHGGEVGLLIGIGANGELTEWLPLRYTHRLFAESAIEAMKQWRFEPARLRGEAVPVSLELKFIFEVKGVVVSVSPADTVMAHFHDLAGGRGYAPCTLRELDRIPVPLKTVAPVYPEELAERGITGEVTVHFYIDEQGTVRMPYVSGRPHQILANLAVDSVRQWRFEPPTRRGQPVLVQVRQVFKFSPSRTAAPQP